MKKYIPAIVILLALGVGAFLLWQKENSTTTDIPSQNATTTEQMASTTDIFSQPPIIPKAKVSTEGWKTCRNEEASWEIMYPNDWYAYSGSRDTFTYIQPSSDLCHGSRITFSITKPEDITRCAVSRQCDIQSLSIRFYKDRDLLGVKYKSATSVESFILPGKEYKRLWLDADALLTNNQVWILKNNDVYWMTITNTNTDLLYTIFSTFHFLDTATSSTQ